MPTYNTAIHPPTLRPSSPHPTVPATVPSPHQTHRVALSRSGDIWDVPSSPSDSESDKSPSIPPRGEAPRRYRHPTGTFRLALPGYTVIPTSAKPCRKRKHDSDDVEELDPNDDKLLEAERAFMAHLRKKAKTVDDRRASGGGVAGISQTGGVASMKTKVLPRYRQRGQRFVRRNAVVSAMQQQDLEAGNLGMIRCGKGKDVDGDGDGEME